MKWGLRPKGGAEDTRSGLRRGGRQRQRRGGEVREVRASVEDPRGFTAELETPQKELHQHRSQNCETVSGGEGGVTECW